MQTEQLFIGGTWRPPVSGETYPTINPATEEESARVAKGDERDVDLAVQAARTAFDSGPWSRMNAAERGRIVWKLADLIMANLDEMARLESICTGKTLFDSGKVEIPFAAEVFRYYAGWATKIHGETLALREGAFTFTLRHPVGVVGAIVPWNFPFLLASWKIAPALAAGNTVVLKPASLTPLTALKFAGLCAEAGLPEGAFNVVTGPGSKAGMALVRHPGVDKIAFTGSTEVGKQIMREAAGALKRVSLELGGKSPNIVFADADTEAAIKGAMTGIFYNKGEVCAAGSRLFVEERIHDEFMAKLTERVKGLKVGDPMDKATRMGPVVSRQQMETVLAYIEAGKQEGARLVTGGGR
ncbi:MAG: aldehyde dehydrogenase family protein, partial [Candidatus Rokubacteria bacterium]|nr:aldehyde dehydrogenase family protein [Candidatus Rokubacteria bacterium]